MGGTKAKFEVIIGVLQNIISKNSFKRFLQVEFRMETHGGKVLLNDIHGEVLWREK